jgi:hypothetical protein
MANAIYPKFKQSLMTANATSTNLAANTGNDVKVALCNSTFTYVATHANVAQVSGIIQGAAPSTGAVVYANGTVDMGDVTFPTVPSGTAAQSIIIYKWNGTTGTSQLVCYLESASVTGLPVTPNGGDITITWDAAGVFTL